MRLSSTTSHTWAMMSWNRTRPSWRNSSIITTASTATEVCHECYIIVSPFYIAIHSVIKSVVFFSASEACEKHVSGDYFCFRGRFYQ